MKEVTLVNYDIGNLLSVKRAILHVGGDLEVASTADRVLAAKKLILPGVGAFASCTSALKEKALWPAIKKAVIKGTPLLGICVGMQMLFETSNEFGLHQGLGLIPGSVKAIPATASQGANVKIPHIGWSALKGQKKAFGKNILKDVPLNSYVYFVHSYAASPAIEEENLAYTSYGEHRICAMVRRDNIYGTQFHPEKSGPVGLKILENFINL